MHYEVNVESNIISAIQANLFPPAHKAIPDWKIFPWHIGNNQQPDTHKLNSSQALAIDVFGTIKTHPNCTNILNHLAGILNIPQSTRWELDLEWIAPTNPLCEINQHTQVDVLAQSDEALIFFECKFTEPDGGNCSQPKPLTSGAHKGWIQCNGNYVLQTNPANGKTNRCALSAKKIRYWEVIPEIFLYDAGVDHSPCPFAGSWYQWMRNMTNAYAIAQESGRRAVFCLVYADASGLQVANMVHSDHWRTFLSKVRPDCVPVHAISYQDVVKMAKAVGQSEEWDQLEEWVSRKIAAV